MERIKISRKRAKCRGAERKREEDTERQRDRKREDETERQKEIDF
jgi:hypothetical protein